MKSENEKIKYNSILTKDKLRMTFTTYSPNISKFNYNLNLDRLPGKFSSEILLNLESKWFNQLLEVFEFGELAVGILNENESKNYKSKWSLFYGWRLIGFLYSDSRFSNDYTQLELEKEIFYDGYFKSNFNGIMNSLQNNLNLRFNNICQLDLAVDTNFDVFSILSAIVDQHISNPYFQGLEKIDHEVVKKFGGRNISEAIYGSIIPNLKVLQPYPSTIYIGGSQNGKQIKVYDKNLLHETYQYEHFQKNLGHNSCWYRLECSLIRNNDPNQFDEEIKLENLNDDQFLIDLFFKKCSKLLTFKNLNDFEKKKNGKKKYTNLIKISELLSIKTPCDAIDPNESLLSPFSQKLKTTNKPNERKRWFKSLVKDFFTIESISLLEKETYFKEIKNSVLTFSLINTDENLISDSDIEENLEKAAEIIRHTYEENFKNRNLGVLRELLQRLQDEVCEKVCEIK